MALVTKSMTDEQYETMRQIIYDRSGIWFGDAKKYLLESRLSKRIEELGLDDFDQYAILLNTGMAREEEFHEMFSLITINETSFFRNEPQLRVLEKTVLPQIVEERGTLKRLRIWSAACSTGQEPYTLAMIVHRMLGIRLMDWRVEVLATDISDRVLKIASDGIYPDSALRNMPPTTVQRYFKKQANGDMAVDPTVRSMVQFKKLNLKDTRSARVYGTFDVIFCRNVMIYFDDKMRESCLNMFHSQLAKDGTLFIGHSESIRNSTIFKPRSESHSFAYQKS